MVRFDWDEGQLENFGNRDYFTGISINSMCKFSKKKKKHKEIKILAR